MGLIHEYLGDKTPAMPCEFKEIAIYEGIGMAVDMNKLNVFVGKFVEGQADMAVIGEELVLYKGLAPWFTSASSS